MKKRVTDLYWAKKQREILPAIVKNPSVILSAHKSHLILSASELLY